MVTGHQHPPRGLDLGYARVSSTEQSLDRQLDALATAGISIDRVYSDKRTGTAVNRPGLIDYAREGDTIVVHTLDRALFAEMERTYTAERAAHARTVAQAAGRHVADHSPTEQTRSSTLGYSRPRVTPLARSAPRPASRRPHCTTTSQVTRDHRRLRR
jgi:DNA invertase Pin-like site-specific DNA recombinase